MSDYRYDAFISYRHVEPDRSYAKWLHKALETYRVPKDLVKQGFPSRIKRVFRDEEELPASADLSNEINSALEGSKFLIVICSPRIVESIWCDAEVKKFRDLGRHDKILALLIEGEPSESFLPALCEIRRSVIKEDGTKIEEIEQVEPLAADVRPRSDESQRELKYLAKLRLIACILGCRFDDLRKREEKRRKKIMLVSSLFLAALVVVFFALTLWALKAESTANKQRILAEENGAEAKKQKNIAEQKAAEALEELKRSEDLSGFMLFRLRNELYSLGRSDLLKDVAEKNLDYYLSRDVSSLDSEQKYKIATALANSAEAVILHGDIDKAVASYKKSVDLFMEICKSEPKNKKWFKEKAEVIICYANCIEQQGEDEKAMQLIKSSVDSLMEGVKKKGEEDNVVYTSRTLYMLAEYYYRKENAEEALKYYRSNLAKLNQYTSSEKHKDKIELHRILGMTLRDMGQLELDRNNVSAAYDHLKTSVNVMNWVVDNSDSNHFKHDLVQSLHKLAVVNNLNGRDDLAEKDFIRAANIMKDLVSRDENNIEWSLDLAKTSLALGILYKDGEEFEKAAEHLEKGMDVLLKVASEKEKQDEETATLLIAALLKVIDVNVELKRIGKVNSGLSAVESLMELQKDNSPEFFLWKIQILSLKINVTEDEKKFASLLREKSAICATALEFFPDSEEVFSEWAYSQQNLIQNHLLKEERMPAEKLINSTVEKIRARLNKNPGNEDLRWSLYELLETLSLILYENGEFENCLSSSDAALKEIRFLYENDSADLDYHRAYSLMLKSRGVLLNDLDREKDAVSSFQKSLVLMKSLIIKTPEDEELAETLKAVQNALGNK